MQSSAREPEEPSEAPTSAPAARRWGLAALVLVVLQLGLLLDGARRVGPTYDEHFYIAAGYSYLTDGDFALNREHPPLLKLMAGAPLKAFGDVEVGRNPSAGFNFPVGFFYQRNSEQLHRNLFVSRLPFCLLTALLTVAVYRVGARRFGPRSGFAAAALLALNPNVLAHGRLAALDAGVAAFMFFSTVAFLDLLERPSTRTTLWSGAAFGLAQLAKFTSLLLVPLFFGLTAVECARTRSLRPLLALARTVAIGLTVFAIGYGFEAKSANEAWNVGAYTVSVPGEAPTGEQLAGWVEDEVDASSPALEGFTERLRGAQDPDQLRQLLVGGLHAADLPDVARGLARALTRAPRAPGELRKELFGAVLMSEALDDATRLEVLPRLADRQLLADGGEPLEGRAGVERWGQWYGAERFEDWDRQLFVTGPFEKLTRGLLGDTLPIPLFSAIRGVDYQLYHGKYGHGSYYRGETLHAGRSFVDGNPHPEYYADVMALKNPLGFLLAVLLAVPAGLVLGRRWTDRPWTALDAIAFLGLPLAAFYLFSTGNALMGVRYVLPVFPFLALAAGRIDRVVPFAGVALAGLAALESLWVHPHQLMYYNLPAGGPVGGPVATVVGDDWGQDVQLVARWREEHSEFVAEAGGLHYEPYSMADLAAFGLEDVLPIQGPVRGLVAVHAINYYREAADYRWLEGYEPFERLGWSVYLFDTRVPQPGGDGP